MKETLHKGQLFDNGLNGSQQENKIMDTKELLERMLPAINNIDNGCDSCISAFVREVNPAIKESGFRFTTYKDGEGIWASIKVKVTEKSTPLTDEEKEDAYFSGDWHPDEDEEDD